MIDKKYYKTFSKIIMKQRKQAENVSGDAYEACEDFANSLADFFQKDNPKFNKINFLITCGIIEEKE